MRLVDSHTHIFDEAFDEDREEVVSRACQADVQRMLLPNIDSSTLSALIDTHQKFPLHTDIAIGLHPTSVQENWSDELKTIEDSIKKYQQEIKAIGEIGLDYYWDKTFYEEQKEVLQQQIDLALHYKKPIILHTREAHREMVEMITQYQDTEIKGVFHSFTGSEEELLELLNFDRFYIGINGVVTFKNSTLRDFIKHIPLNRLLLETDAPYLAPVPKRGKRNEPSFLKHTLGELARVFDVSEEELAEQTWKNYEQLFLS